MEYVDVSNRGCQPSPVTGLEQYSDIELLQELARRGYALKNFSKVRVELHKTWFKETPKSLASGRN